MRRELDEKLCTDYPEIFVQRRQPMDQTAMCWGFECGDGWYEIIADLCGAIMLYCDEHDVTVPQAVQVKEKFGGLRFYLNGTDDTISSFVRDAEEEAARTCELTGDPGVLTCTDPKGRGYYQTLSPAEAKGLGRYIMGEDHDD